MRAHRRRPRARSGMNRRRATFDPVPDPGLRTSSTWHEVEPPRYCGAPAGVALAGVLTAVPLVVWLVLK